MFLIRYEHESQKVIFENYVTTGFNYRMTDIQAAVGIEQLKRLDDIVSERRSSADSYKKLLQDIPHIQPPHEDGNFHSNWQSYPVKLADGISFNQKDIMQRLLDKGISTRRGIMNAHQEPAYQAAPCARCPGVRRAGIGQSCSLYTMESEKKICAILQTHFVTFCPA